MSDSVSWALRSCCRMVDAHGKAEVVQAPEDPCVGCDALGGRGRSLCCGTGAGQLP